MKNPLILLFQFPIKAYTLFVSPWLGGNCRFSPTCSAYTVEALEKHGILKGLYLSAKRLCQCHPFCKRHGHDPVPEHFEWAIDWRRPFRYNHTDH